MGTWDGGIEELKGERRAQIALTHQERERSRVLRTGERLHDHLLIARIIHFQNLAVRNDQLPLLDRKLILPGFSNTTRPCDLRGGSGCTLMKNSCLKSDEKVVIWA